MKRRRRWGILGLAHFARVPLLLHLFLTLNRVRVTDARDAKYLVTTSTVTSTVTIGASYCFTTKKLFFGALTPRCGKKRGKRAIYVDPIPGASSHRNQGRLGNLIRPTSTAAKQADEWSELEGAADISFSASGDQRRPRIFPWWGRSVNSWDVWKYFYYIVTTTSTVWTTSFQDTTTVTLKCTPDPSSTLYINYGPYGHNGHYGEYYGYHDNYGKYGKQWSTTYSSSVFSSC